MAFIIDIILIAVFAMMLFSGIKNGFVRSVLSIAAVALAALFALWLSAPASELLYETFVRVKLETAVASQLPDMGSAQLTAENTQAVINSLPEVLVHFASSLGVDLEQIAGRASGIDLSAADMAAELTEQIARPIALAVLRALAFGVLFLLLSIVLQIAVSLISRFFDLPVLKTLNRWLGGALGAVKGLLVVAVLALVLDAIASIVAGGDFARLVSGSKIVDIIVSTGIFSRLALA